MADTQIEEVSGKKRAMRRSNCACCQTCWVYQDSGHCLYGGPYSGYQDMTQPKPETTTNE